jgi:hypothetical protein
MAHVKLGSEQDEGVQCHISSDLATDKYDGNPLARTDAGENIKDVKIVFGGKFLLFGTDPKKILRGKRVYVGQGMS